MIKHFFLSASFTLASSASAESNCVIFEMIYVERRKAIFRMFMLRVNSFGRRDRCWWGFRGWAWELFTRDGFMWKGRRDLAVGVFWWQWVIIISGLWDIFASSGVSRWCEGGFENFLPCEIVPRKKNHFECGALAKVSLKWFFQEL